MDFQSFSEEWSEEAKPLDVVEVEMREEDVDRCARRAEGFAKPTNPASRVEDEDAAVVCAELYTGGVPAVAHRFGPGAREGTACPPQRDLHGTGQNRVIAPSKRSPCPRSGSAGRRPVR